MARKADPDREVTEQEQLKLDLAAGKFSNDDEDATLSVLIADAAANLEAKATVLANLQESRIVTTLLVNRGVGSEAQRAWVKAYLPRKERKSGEDAAAEA